MQRARFRRSATRWQAFFDALARHGFAVTGLDLSGEMLARAAAAAEAAGVVVEWLHDDATRFDLPARFDAAICLCEGAFGLLSQADDALDQPLAILSNISRSLRPGAPVALTMLSDPATSVEASGMPPRDGLDPVAVRERGFTPAELTLMFRLAGFAVTYVVGGTAGNWGLRPLELDEMEIMVMARKVGEPVGAFGG